ncbi:hypothetical protein MUU74_11130 [Chryseobacterium daecheongense]|uniref:hypothetical protein n=1 Tax=Chryseobacterium daecheongense TaxID=192389 RepID=UPI001FD705D5|nr:hypothetical protein [Chryseobacterium daecheongense]UOU97047.1 hypothetical protein MUU74_11130 [Chryseobacterium daecheongense]
MSRKIIFLIFISIYSCIAAQTYEFDYYVRTKIENTGNKAWSTQDNMINSKNLSYIAKVHNAHHKGFLEVEVLDYDQKVIHFFEIENTDDFSDSKNFKYSYSAHLEVSDKSIKEMSSSVYKQKDSEGSAELKKVFIEKFKKDTSKNPEFTISADLQKVDGDLRPYALAMMTNSLMKYLKIEISEMGFISNAEIKYNKKTTVLYHSEILAKENIKLYVDPKEIKLPEKDPKSQEERLNEIVEDIKRNNK